MGQISPIAVFELRQGVCQYLRRKSGELMKKLLLASAVAATSLMAAGYKIPEQSLNSTALAGAYVSNTSAADAAYYNPANGLYG